MWSAFVGDPDNAQSQCQSVVDLAGYDLFDEAASVAFKHEQSEMSNAFHVCNGERAVRSLDISQNRNLMPKWDQFDDYASICTALDGYDRFSVVSFEDILVASIKCRGVLETVLSVLFNENTADHRDVDAYCEQYAQPGASGDITFGKLAYWNTGADGTHYFNCLQKVSVQAQTQYFDNRARLCAIMADASDLSALGDAFDASDALDLVGVTAELNLMNTPLIPKNEYRWVDVTKSDAGDWSISPIATLEIHIALPAEVDLTEMADSIQEKVQQIVAFGKYRLAVEGEGGTTVLQYDAPRDYISPHVANINALSGGFTIDGNHFAVTSVKIPQDLTPAVANAFNNAGVTFEPVSYTCALRRSDLTPRLYAESGSVGTETEAPASNFRSPPVTATGPPLATAPVTTAAPAETDAPEAPVEETSDSTVANFAAFALAD